MANRCCGSNPLPIFLPTLMKLQLYAAMLKLERFTVSELAIRLSRKPTSVQTALGRLNKTWRTVDRQSFGKRGGQTCVYSLTPQGVAALSEYVGKELHAVRTDLPVEAPAEPMGLVTARQVLKKMEAETRPAVFNMLRAEAEGALKWASLELEDGWPDAELSLYQDRLTQLKSQLLVAVPHSEPLAPAELPLVRQDSHIWGPDLAIPEQHVYMASLSGTAQMREYQNIANMALVQCSNEAIGEGLSLVLHIEQKTLPPHRWVQKANRRVGAGARCFLIINSAEDAGTVENLHDSGAMLGNCTIIDSSSSDVLSDRIFQCHGSYYPRVKIGQLELLVNEFVRGFARDHGSEFWDAETDSPDPIEKRNRLAY